MTIPLRVGQRWQVKGKAIIFEFVALRDDRFLEWEWVDSDCMGDKIDLRHINLGFWVRMYELVYDPHDKVEVLTQGEWDLV